MARGFLRPKRRDARTGSVSTEFALLSPVFVLFLMGTVELSLMMGAQQLLENAAFNTSRLAKTGYSGSGQSQGSTVSQIMTNELQSYGSLINTANVTMTESSYSSFQAAGSGTGGTSGYGGQQQIVVYKITYPWHLFTPVISHVMGTNGVVNLKTQIVVRNEPYGS
jgi:Flp pilus assembly protein TadG